MEIGEVQDPQFQEREWQVQRIGWVVLFAFIVGAALGLFGPGPLSLSRAQSTDQRVQVEYYRFARLGGKGTVAVTVVAGEAPDGSADVWWNSTYLEEMTVNGVTPEPDTVTAVDGRIRYGFAAEAGDGLTVTFDLTPDSMGFKHAEIAAGDGTDGVTYGQFIYP